MRLNTVRWGSGDRVALLVHGMLGSAAQYHQVGPALAERGYRAIAVDLPGHGDSPAAPDATMDLFVDAVLESVDHRPSLAIGHSLGAVVLSHALPRLRPARVVYVDVPFDSPSGDPPSVDLRERFTAARAARTEQHLRTRHPGWSADDCRLGFSVRSVRGAGHCVWYGFLDDFMATLDAWEA
ncbi:alpha/beta fold hydrolase [Kribbella sp. NPDC049584]|uniref:alpha/beta fold hydrolase n=1 Tax=Kribbella sp. NPDC049584 TaxID=3154833 RepID=UPI00343D5462